MHDTNPLAILLALLAATILPAYLLRAINRLAMTHRLKRSLRLAVGRELDGEPGGGLVRDRVSRPVRGPSGEDKAA